MSERPPELLEGHDYGVLTPLLLDKDISEVMVNGAGQVYVEAAGKLSLTDVRFPNDEALLRIIQDIAHFVGRRVDEDSPMVDARLPDGSRVNAIIPPLAVDGPALTIRKFARDPFTVEDLIHGGTLTLEAAAFLEAAVRARLSILVSGGTGSGKTTTLNVLSSFIGPDERIITIEDAAELQLRQQHKVRLESRQSNLEGKGRVTIRELMINALRMRPDRIVIGEVRGGEALDLLQAMNSGHDGSLSTIHANSPRDALARLETLVLMGGLDLPARAIREQIAAALEVVVHIVRMRDGSRRISSITEVLGREAETITMQEIFLLEESVPDGDDKVAARLAPTGIRPNAMAKIYARGVPLAPALRQLFPDRKAPDFTVGVRR